MRTAAAIKIGPLLPEDVKRVRQLFEASANQQFVIERQCDNVNGPPPTFSRDQLWYVLIGCLLTTQQRSTRGSPINRFLEMEPFPLALSKCNTGNISTLVETEIKKHGGIRRGPTIGRQAQVNFDRLESGEWRNAELTFRALLEQRKRSPASADKEAERGAARWVADTFAGFGPKQARNLWQWLGLTRYEIPLDSRVSDWINKNLSVNVKASRLPDSRYYEAVLDYVQELCEGAGVLPCMFDAAAFRYDDAEDKAGSGNTGTTRSGYVNRHEQVVVRNTGQNGTDHFQFVYQLACSRCGHTYGANGSDIFERKCPNCQGGKPGLVL